MARVMAQGGREVADALQARVDEISQAISAKTGTIAETLSTKAEQIGETLEARATALNQVLGDRAEEIANTLDQRVTAFEDRVVNRLDGVVETIDAKGQAVLGSLGNRIGEIRSIFDTQGTSLVANLSERGSEIGREMASVSETTLRNLEERSNAIIDGLQNRTMELTSSYSRSSDVLRAAFDEGTSRTIETLTNTNQRLQGELTELLARLQETGREMQQVAASATGNLGAIEEGLASQVQQIQGLVSEITNQTSRASEQVADQVEALRSVSHGAMQQASELTYNLEERSRSLTESTREQLQILTQAATALEQVETRMNAALNGRQEALNELLERINQRSQDLETVTRTFTALVEGSLQNVEGKARQIGAVLADSAQATTQAIGEQFELIRTTTGAEGERTAAALRTAYERAAAEMAEALNNATAKFRDTMGELRGMTSQIQRELENTRSELRRGVIELPQETQETTANMRRVVADQIKALNELSALVSRSARMVDAAPAVQPRRVNEAQAAAAVAAAVMPAPAPAPAQTVARQVEKKVAPAPAPAPAPARPAQPAAERPAPRRDEAPAREGGNRGGWLSDLLNRASREDQSEPASAPSRSDRARVNSLESLDSISVDIARMIDHDAAVELWDRYKRGERNVFTRRLYTIQGQQTFEEIRRKYRHDEEFKQTVDRYVEEFERLLAEVSRDDRDSMLTKTYLTSETGKVYTMLAHASGRFD
jgi:DNA anti-recombination protein RmuC